MPPRKSKKAPAPVPKAPTTPCPAPHPTPPPWDWAAPLQEASYGRGVSVQISPMSLGQLSRKTLRVPTYQRGVVWEPARQASFCQAAMVCRVSPPVTLLAHRQQTYVLDGQQRLTALGVRLERADGSVNLTSAGMNLRTGQWQEISPRNAQLIEDLPEGTTAYLAAEIARGNLQHLLRFKQAMNQRYAGEDYPPEVAEALRDQMSILHTQTWCQALNVPVVQIEAYDDTPEVWSDVLAVFRMVNTPGVSFDLAELERVLAGGHTAIW